MLKKSILEICIESVRDISKRRTETKMMKISHTCCEILKNAKAAVVHR